MRTHQWMTAFLSGAILLLGSWKAEAQSPNGSGYATYTPISAQVPEGFNPYPTISPFENAFSETYNENGHWLFNSNNNTQYRYYASIEALIAYGAAPNDAKVGYGNVVRNPFFVDGTDSLDNSDFGTTFAFTPNALIDLVGINGPYPDANAGFITDPRMNGIQLRLGIDSPNGQTFEFTAQGIFPGQSHLVHGRPIFRVGNPFLPANSAVYVLDQFYGNAWENAIGVDAGPNGDATVEVVDVDVINVFNPGLSVDDGSEDGTIIRADLFQRKSYQTDVYGAQATILQMPSREVGPFTVRPLFGLRYLKTNSNFDIEMHDSGLEYEVDPDYEAGMSDAIRPGGVEDFELFLFPTRMYLSSEVETQLGGAEMGWRYSAGGASFLFDGETRIGVMAGQEKIRVKSKGLGQPFWFNQPGAIGNANLFYDPDLVTFDDQMNSYVTPTFQQSFNTTTRPFQHVPGLRSIPMFREANFKAGWTFLAVFQMSRPENSIIYQTGNGAIPPGFGALLLQEEGDPTLIPESKVDRSFWYVQYFNLGLEWIY